MIHIASKTPTFLGSINETICGLSVYIALVTWLQEGEREGWVGLEPTCETCILLHWAHPENTFKLLPKTNYL